MIQANLTDIQQRWNKAKPTKTMTFWIAIGAIILTMLLGFTQGGWTTESNAKQMAEVSARNAVVERLVSICVAQFNADTQRTEKLEELKTIASYQRLAYVKEQGWAVMPGDSAPDTQVATECGQQLALLN